ncbi:MAG: Rrf2 family transcriptional regulator [Planctomycetota bacterium]|jgi:Rrf2 family protein|nr:Rrf2 family transcriptional regulator [Planctomycetota bacterium]MDP6989828.1 Rrf2 family transcriptional regulator [Planctomycetota bacterium]
MRAFSKSSEYAIRALTRLAQKADGGPYQLARELADDLGIPAPFLGKILQSLASAGLLESQRGRRGGFRLAAPAESISLMRILEVLDNANEERECILGQADCTDERACPLHEFWKQTSEDFLGRVRHTSLSDLILFCERNPNSEYPVPRPA